MSLMQIRTTRIFLSCIALILPAIIASADTVEIRLIGIETMRRDLYIKQGDEFEEVMVPLYERSSSYEVEPEGNSLQLYKKNETPEGTILFEIAAEGKLPSGAQSALGVYLIAPDGSPRLQFFNDDWSVFPKRSYRIINISPVVIKSKIDDSIIQIPPLQSGIASANQVNDVPTVSVITVYKNGNDTWQAIHDKRETLLPDWRTTGIAVVTTGKLYEVLDTDYTIDPANPMKATLSYFTFTDEAYNSAEKVARRNKAE